MVKEYTGRYKGFQIRDVAYLGEPPTDIPPTFDVVKWRNEGEEINIIINKESESMQLLLDLL